MAEILVKFGDQGLDVSAYRHGDPVVVRDDGWVWGRCESKAVWIAEGNDPAFWPGNTVMLKIPGVTADQVLQFVQNNADGLRQRANNFDLSAFSNLSPGDVITATKQQALNRLRVKT